MTLNNVKTLDKKADVFIDGNVIARNMLTRNGQQCSLGFVLPGDYRIKIEDSETVEVLGGNFLIKLPESEGFETFKEGETFYIPENGEYELKVDDYFDYYCIFGL